MAVDLLIQTGWLLLFAGFDTSFKDVFWLSGLNYFIDMEES